eukprot:6185627-Pleurochrysis_carterae.AAC.3
MNHQLDHLKAASSAGASLGMRRQEKERPDALCLEEMASVWAAHSKLSLHDARSGIEVHLSDAPCIPSASMEIPSAHGPNSPAATPAAVQGSAIKP